MHEVGRLDLLLLWGLVQVILQRKVMDEIGYNPISG